MYQVLLIKNLQNSAKVSRKRCVYDNSKKNINTSKEMKRSIVSLISLLTL